MAVHASSSLPLSLPHSFDSSLPQFTISHGLHRYGGHGRRSFVVRSQLQTPRVDKSSLNVAEAVSNAELWAASVLRFSNNGEDRVVVGTLDLNQCIRLPDEIAGMKTKGIRADFARAYPCNVCVAKELHRNGLGYSLVADSKIVAEDWGISDLYVHVAVDNEPAKNLYIKSGFIYMRMMSLPRFLDRPRRILLWSDIPNNEDL